DEGQRQICKGIYLAVADFFNQPESNIATTHIADNSQELFKIQIAAVKNKIDEKNLVSLSKIGDISIIEKNGFYKYQIGGFSSILQAERAQEKCRQLGYEGAFIVK
ncbi:MAG: hypothetical protein RLZZ546_2265, partial [Bacteroidota bacterium]